MRSAPVDYHCIIGNDPVWSGTPDPNRIKKQEQWRMDKLVRKTRDIERAMMDLGLTIEGTDLDYQLSVIKAEIAEYELKVARAELSAIISKEKS